MIGELFGKAYELWKRNVTWLVLAGLVTGLIVGGLMAVGTGALVASARSAFVGGLSDTDTGTAMGTGSAAGGLIVYLVLLAAAEVLAMVLYGGMFEMVIGAERESRGVRFGDLFSGFGKFGAYFLFALAWFGISIALSLLSTVLPVIGALISVVVSVWVSVIWIYVLPLIADQRLGFGDAARRSRDMVSGVGWGTTFGMLVLLYVALIAIAVVIGVISYAVYAGNDTAGAVLGAVLFIALAVLAAPFAICYISAMYLGSDPVPAVTSRFGLPQAPPPPAVGAGTAAGGYQPSPPPAVPAGADAWKAAADPVASYPVQSLHAPAARTAPATAAQPAPEPPSPGPTPV